MSTPDSEQPAVGSAPAPTLSPALTKAATERLGSALGSRLRIERELGRGGMAIVYLARDLRHDRAVAVKVFRETLAESVGAERFLREIQIAAQLQHPHIVALLDSGEAAGMLYYFMPFVDGETLRAKMSREGNLPIETTVHIARDVADALAYAHRHGVIHRDIKPENVLLADGHALVTDFGIARAVDVAATALTQTGLALGTPAYMAPEQAFGEREVDPRADLFALGCVLHEMLIGTSPYGGSTPQAMLLRRLTDAVPLLREARPDVPEWLDDIIARMLAADPGARPASAEDVLEVLKERSAPFALNSSGERRRPPRSIAVLPFTNMSADAENEYFAEGISEELINALAQFPNLRVIARTSSFSFKGKNVDVREMGRALGVGHIVEGSVRKAASALRITAQLIDAVDGSHLWAARYDRTLADAFVIQDEITSAIRDAVGATLFTGADTAKVQTDEETYDFFLRGRALPVAGQFTDAEAAACAMIENDPRYPEGYHMRGYTRNYMGRFQEAEDDLRRVPTLGNRSGWPLAKRSIALTGLGRLDEVRQILDAMHARRATEFITPDAIGCVHQLLGQNDDAFHWLDRAVHEQALWAGFVGVDPIFAPLRRDARFESFCQAHGLPLRPLPPSALDKLATPSK